MDVINFRIWLRNKGCSNKVLSDNISRLKRLEREIEKCDIDEQYRNDGCEYLFNLLNNNGVNKEMQKYPNTNLPIGKRYMSTYRLALKKYIAFLEDITLNNQ